MASLWVAAEAARGHSVSVSRGTIVIGANAIEANLSIPIDDLLHAFRPAFDDQERLSAEALEDCVRKYELQVLKHFIVRDAAGKRLNGRVTSVAHSLSDAVAHDRASLRGGRASFRLEFALSDPPEYLTFQQTFLSDGPSHAAQLVLDVRTDSQQPGRVVQLTNRGNVETLRFHWQSAETAASVEAPAEFSRVQAEFDRTPHGLRLSISIPLALAETWWPVIRSDPDFVTFQEWSAARPKLAEIIESGAAIQVDGKRAESAAAWVTLVSPDLPAGGTPDRLQIWSSWTARVVATQEFEIADSTTDVSLNWELFNSAVLEAMVTCTEGGRKWSHTLTPYEPNLRWPADGMGGAVSP